MRRKSSSRPHIGLELHVKVLGNILKGIFVIISIICIAFSAFFVYSAVSGNTGPIDKLERGLSTLAHVTGISTPAGSTSTVGMLTQDFGLSTSQAATVIDIADQLGVNTDDPAAVSGFVAKNIGNKDEIQDIAAMYQAGEISESQAKSMLKDIVNV